MKLRAARWLFLRASAPVFYGLGAVLMLLSVAMLLPLGVAYALQDEALAAYDAAFLLTFAAGFVLWMSTRRGPKDLRPRDSYVLVTAVWSVVPVFAAIPFLFYFADMSFTDAYFEAVAGLTTTGATVLSGLDALPPSIHVWRGLLQWLGGMGIIVLFIAVLPVLRIGGRQLYLAETPGPLKETRITPRIAETAKGLWLVYAGLTAACMLAYGWAGMSWLDAVVHAFTTTSLGGFSTHDASFGYFDSPAIEAIAITFMLVSGVSFATHFSVLYRKSLEPYRTDQEARWFLAAMIGASLLIASYLWLQGVYADFLSALRYAAFNVISIGTTTGYASTDYGLWPVFAPVVMLVLCATAASAGSTGGGIKMVRTQLLILQVHRELIRLLHPAAQVPLKLSGQTIPNSIVFAVLAFMSVYGATIVIFALLLLASGLDVITAFSAVIASITNTGPGLNEVGPATTYASLTDFQTWILSLAMILGRLEIMTVLVLFSPAFWKR